MDLLAVVVQALNGLVFVPVLVAPDPLAAVLVFAVSVDVLKLNDDAVPPGGAVVELFSFLEEDVFQEGTALPLLDALLCGLEFVKKDGAVFPVSPNENDED